MALIPHLSLYMILQSYFCLSSASTPGTLALFLDESCEQSSSVNPSTNLPINTCLVASGALGIAVTILPPCTSGNASVTLYHDSACARPLSDDFPYNNCYFDGPNGIPGLALACKSAGGAAAPITATTTVRAGSSVLPVAVDTATDSSSGNNAVSQPTSNSANPTAASSSSSSDSGTSPTSTSNSASGAGNDSTSGLGQRGQIALGVGLPVGSILVALLAWWFPCKKKKRTNHSYGAPEGSHTFGGPQVREVWPRYV